MTTVLSPEEVFLPTTRWPNEVRPIPAASVPDHPSVIGRPRFSVENWTPDDHYAGPSLADKLFREARERGGRNNFGRKVLRSSVVPVPEGGRRDFYADPPADFWPCTRKSMEEVGMNAMLRVNPTFSSIESEGRDTGSMILVGLASGVAGYYLMRWLMRRSLSH